MTMTTTSFEQIRERSAALKAQIDAMQKEAAEQIKPLLQQFITAYPQVAGVRWTQYTPYFNDGDPCTFRMGGIEFAFAAPAADADPEDEDDQGYDELGAHWVVRDGQWGYVRTWDNDSFNSMGLSVEEMSEETYKACVELERHLNNLKDELEVLFGDHCRVTVTKSGVEVSEYERD